jgi:uncharacterized membrane protein
MNTRSNIYVACALIALIGLPFILCRVKPNRYYGLRTRASIADSTLWNDANADAGWALLAAAAASALRLFFLPATYRARHWPMLAVFRAPLAVAMGAGRARLRRLERGRALPPTSWRATR